MKRKYIEKATLFPSGKLFQLSDYCIKVKFKKNKQTITLYPCHEILISFGLTSTLDFDHNIHSQDKHNKEIKTLQYNLSIK